MRRRGIIDTGPLVAFVDTNDAHHAWAVEALRDFDAPLETCDAVLSEAWFLLGRARRGREALIGLLRAAHVAPTFSLTNELTPVLKLMEKYADQPMSVADASLVCMAELHPSAAIITVDSDFRVYRRGRSPLRLVAPFATRK